MQIMIVARQDHVKISGMHCPLSLCSLRDEPTDDRDESVSGHEHHTMQPVCVAVLKDLCDQEDAGQHDRCVEVPEVHGEVHSEHPAPKDCPGNHKQSDMCS